MKKSGSLRNEDQMSDQFIVEYDGESDPTTNYIHINFLVKQITLTRLVKTRPNMDFLDAKIIDLIYLNGEDETEGLHYRFYIKSATPTEICASWYTKDELLHGEYLFEFTKWEIIDD